jgi:hypothetical protein
MSKPLKKIVFSFLTALVLLFSFAPFFRAKAAIPPGGINVGIDPSNLWSHTWYAEENPFAWYQKVYDDSISPTSEIFGERYTAAQVQWVIYGLFSFFWNFIPGNPQLTTCAISGDISSCQTLLQKLQSAIKIGDSSGPTPASTTASIFTFAGQNPISGVYYFKNLIGKFSLISEVHAQGFGYTNAANSIVGIWRVTRNISYGFMVLAIIIFAFMIMFRVKINPQVVITVQLAIPRLVFALILITFSYAIAGFAIDLMYVTIGLLAVLINGAQLTSETPIQLFQNFVSSNSFVLLYNYWIHLLVASIVATVSPGGGFGLGILLVLFAIIAILAVIWWSLKIVWMVIKTFVSIILTIVVGPLEIMLGTVTESTGFGAWLKRLISYLAVYPMMCLMFFLAFFFLNQGGDTAGFGGTIPFNPATNFIGPNSWVPPMSFLTGNGQRLIWILVSFVIFSEITKVAEMAQKFIEGKPWEYGTAVGEVRQGAKNVGQSATDFARLYASTKAIGGTAQGVVNALKWLAFMP